MKKLYIDCSNGIGGDMLFRALVELGADEEYIRSQIPDMGDDSEEPHHRSFSDIRDILSTVGDESVRIISERIYSVIAEAEAEVHGESLENVHFHEVGRNEAVRNISGTAAAVVSLGIDEVFCSEIHDGHGEIRCSHGIIPVPVPAVRAMMRKSSLSFVTDEDVDTEMVTPTGLAVLTGLGAVERERSVIADDALSAEVRGMRDTGRKGGLKVYIF